jgi:hypothetical protein
MREKGLTYREIAPRVGLSLTHTKRLLNPRSMETTLRLSREAKRRRTGQCENCGGPTKYAGYREKRTSPVCQNCAPEVYGPIYRAKYIGKGKNITHLLELLADGPMRYIEICDALGIERDAMGMLLGRAVRHGLIERVSRGLYRLP